MTIGSGGELRRLRALVADLDAVVWEADATSGRFTFVSQRAVDLLGYPPHLWTSDPSFWADHLHPEDRERAVREFMGAVVEGRAHDIEYRFVHRDGHAVWLRDIGHVVHDHWGHPYVIRGLMVDISKQKLAEEQLREAEELFRTLVGQSPVVTYLDAADASDVTLYISPQVEQMLGYAPEELTRGVPLWPDLIHPEDRGRVLAASAAADATHGPYDVEYRLLARDGRTVWVNDRAVLIRDDEGRPKFWQGVWIDVTERKRAAELEQTLETEREEAAQLRALDELKNTFLQAVSHDLRTPLAAILGLAVTLEREDIELHPDDAKDLAARIAANARRLDRMVNDLLDLDRLSRGMVEPNLVPTDLAALVARLVDESEHLAGREVSTHVEPVTAEVDASKVERIVENLLANTARHTPAGTRVWVKVRATEGGALIAVEDEGSGVPADLRSSIFEPFRQGPETPNHSPGVGIGLALVARFAELHGGRAWVEEREGGGASFRVFLPARPPVA